MAKRERFEFDVAFECSISLENFKVMPNTLSCEVEKTPW